jgi:transcriptional regulator with XRE-family HTH domain
MKLAELCEVSTSYIGEIEIGRKYPSVGTFQRIADALKIKPYKLLMDSETFEDRGHNEAIILFSEKIKQNLDAAVDATAARYLIKEKPFPEAAETPVSSYTGKRTKKR